MSKEALNFLINSGLLILILIIAYAVVVKLKLGNGIFKKRAGEINLIDRIFLSKDSQLVLFKVRGTYFLSFIGNGNFYLIKEWKYEKNSSSSADNPN